ncbi:MAG: mechanosensitive ion channel, partial [Planctomycetes bacterium]|nr:mechanosensitive ion channel [Planctomycetota bacterium]
MWEANSSILIPAIYVIAGFIGGFILQFIVFRRLEKWVKITHWKWDDVILESIGHMPIIWSMCAAAYISQFQSDITPEDQEFYSSSLITIFLFTATVVIARMAGGMMERVPSERLPATSLFVSGARFVVYIIGAIIILQNLDIEITPMITALGIGGLAVALALEETLRNLISGVQIIASQLVRPGDYIELEDGKSGYVTDIKARSTTIRSFPDNNRIIVPNNVLASSTVINYSLP